MNSHLELAHAYTVLTHRYADAVDRGDGEAVAAMFDRAGSWNGREFGLDVLTGHDAIVKQFSSSEPSGSVHLVSNHLVVDVSSSRPRAFSTAHAIIPRDELVRHVIVRYEDVLIEQDDEWKFANRTLRRAVSF